MDLHAQIRTILGKKVKRLRKKGLIPAEIYGRNAENIHISIPEKEFTKIHKEAGEHTIINVMIDGKETIPALISHTDLNPVTDHYLSVDLHKVKMDEEITTKVPIEFIGKSPALDHDFIFVKVLDEIEIEVLPRNIPHSIEIDIRVLKEAGDSIHIKDIKLPEGVKTKTSEETVIASIKEQTEEEPEETTETPSEIKEPSSETADETENSTAPPEDKPKK